MLGHLKQCTKFHFIVLSAYYKKRTLIWKWFGGNIFNVSPVSYQLAMGDWLPQKVFQEREQSRHFADASCVADNAMQKDIHKRFILSTPQRKCPVLRRHKKSFIGISRQVSRNNSQNRTLAHFQIRVLLKENWVNSKSCHLPWSLTNPQIMTYFTYQASPVSL